MKNYQDCFSMCIEHTNKHGSGNLLQELQKDDLILATSLEMLQTNDIML